MGLTYSFLVCSAGVAPDLTRPLGETEAEGVMRRLFPRTPYVRVETRPLPATRFPPRETPAVGVFEGGVLMATRDAHLYDPQILNRRYLKITEWPQVQLLTSRSMDNMFAYGRWSGGSLTRSLSVNPTAGVYRDFGAREPFEGDDPVSADHWLDYSNAALATALRLTGDAGPRFRGSLDWECISLHVFARMDRP